LESTEERRSGGTEAGDPFIVTKSSEGGRDLGVEALEAGIGGRAVELGENSE